MNYKMSDEQGERMYPTIIRGKQSASLEKYSCGCIGTRGHCLAHCDGEVDFYKPHNYRGGYVTVLHDVPIKAEQMADPVETMMMIALHRCRKDEHGFITAMERLPITELHDIETLHLEGGNYWSEARAIVPKEDFKALFDDCVVQIGLMRAALLVDKI